jgi:CRP-like cAMP-binding protein
MNPLRNIPMFASLDEKTFTRLDAISVRRHYTKGTFLFFQGETPDRLTVLVKGLLKLYKTNDSGKEIVLNYFTPISLIAEVAVLQSIPYPATGVFEEDSEVVQIDYSAFESLFLTDPQLSKLLILSLSNKVRMLEAVIERGLLMDASERILNLLQKSPDLLHTMRHYEIASMLHMTPENFSRTLKKLKSQGTLIEKNGNVTVVSAPEGR